MSESYAPAPSFDLSEEDWISLWMDEQFEAHMEDMWEAERYMAQFD